MKRLTLILTAALAFCCGQKPANPSITAFSENDGKPLHLMTAPGSGDDIVLPGNYDYEFILCDPTDGWWYVLGPAFVVGVPEEGDPDEYSLGPNGAWISAKDLYLNTVLCHQDKIILRDKPSSDAEPVFVIAPEDVWSVHPLDLRKDWVKVQIAEDGEIGWILRELLCFSAFEVCEDSFPDM